MSDVNSCIFFVALEICLIGFVSIWEYARADNIEISVHKKAVMGKMTMTVLTASSICCLDTVAFTYPFSFGNILST